MVRDVNRSSMTRSVKAALRSLAEASDNMCSSLYPPVSPPRPRVFVLSHDPLLTWPGYSVRAGRKPGETELAVEWHSISYGFHKLFITNAKVERVIVDLLEENGKKIKKFVCQVRAAARWCKRRRLGMEKHSKNLEVQKKSTIETLKIYVLMSRISNNLSEVP